MNKLEIIELIDILDNGEVHIENGGKILAFINYSDLDKFTQILGIDSENHIDCILRDKYVVVNLIDIDIVDCEDVEIIEMRYKANGYK